WLEGLPYLVIAGGALALRFAWSDEPDAAARALARYGLALTASMLAGFLVSVAPGHWSRAACDAMAINWLLAGAGGGLGLELAERVLRGSAAPVRFAAVGIVAVAAGLAFVLVEPRCIHGPFALTDAAVKAIWLDQVDEMTPLMGVVR